MLAVVTAKCSVQTLATPAPSSGLTLSSSCRFPSRASWSVSPSPYCSGRRWLHFDHVALQINESFHPRNSWNSSLAAQMEMPNFATVSTRLLSWPSWCKSVQMVLFGCFGESIQHERNIPASPHKSGWLVAPQTSFDWSCRMYHRVPPHWVAGTSPKECRSPTGRCDCWHVQSTALEGVQHDTAEAFAYRPSQRAIRDHHAAW